MKVIKPTKIQPLFDNVLTTLDVYEDDYYENGVIIFPKGTPMMIQTVICAGDSTTFKEGDMVHINPIRYAKMKHREGSLKDGVIADNAVVEYLLPIIQVGGENRLLLVSRDIDYIVKEFVEEENKAKLILPKKKEFKL